jgi:hypothetical protein
MMRLRRTKYQGIPLKLFVDDFIVHDVKAHHANIQRQLDDDLPQRYQPYSIIVPMLVIPTVTFNGVNL